MRTTPRRKAAAFALLPAAIALATGCAAPTRTPDQPPPAADTSAELTVDAADLLPLTPRSRTFIHRSGGDESRWTFTLEPVDDTTFAWTALEQRRTLLRRGDEGGIVIPEETEWADNSHVQYDPPIPLLPPTLRTGEPVEAEAAMTVLDRASGNRRAAGNVTVSIELLGERQVQTPAGPFDALVIRSQRRIRLDLASVDVTIDAAYAPGIGMVRQTIERRTRALGLFGGTKTETLELAEPPEGGP